GNYIAAFGGNINLGIFNNIKGGGTGSAIANRGSYNTVFFTNNEGYNLGFVGHYGKNGKNLCFINNKFEKFNSPIAPFKTLFFKDNYIKELNILTSSAGLRSNKNFIFYNNKGDEIKTAIGRVVIDNYYFMNNNFSEKEIELVLNRYTKHIYASDLNFYKENKHNFDIKDYHEPYEIQEDHFHRLMKEDNLTDLIEIDPKSETLIEDLLKVYENHKND
ncbi:hypothetical protein ACFL1H_08090, partial [Nanoarchaeota archaeon]